MTLFDWCMLLRSINACNCVQLKHISTHDDHTMTCWIFLFVDYGLCPDKGPSRHTHAMTWLLVSLSCPSCLSTFSWSATWPEPKTQPHILRAPRMSYSKKKLMCHSLECGTGIQLYNLHFITCVSITFVTAERRNPDRDDFPFGLLPSETLHPRPVRSTLVLTTAGPCLGSYDGPSGVGVYL